MDDSMDDYGFHTNYAFDVLFGVWTSVAREDFAYAVFSGVDLTFSRHEKYVRGISSENFGSCVTGPFLKMRNYFFVFDSFELKKKIIILSWLYYR